MLNKKNIAIAMAVATVAPVAAPLVVMADEVKNVEISAGDKEAQAKVKAELEKLSAVKYTNNKVVPSDRPGKPDYTEVYAKFEMNTDGTNKDVPVYRIEKADLGSKTVIKVTDRGHREAYETTWDPSTNTNKVTKVIYDHENGKNIEEKLLAEITIHNANGLNHHNIEASELYKTNGKLNDRGLDLTNFLASNDSVVKNRETVVDGNKTGVRFTVTGTAYDCIITVWGNPKTDTTDSQIGSLAGLDRAETAVQVSQQGWKDGSADTVILAGWNGTPDALSATPLASALNAPILLATEHNGLDANTKAEIDRLQARNVIIVGGETHVSSKVVEQLKGMGLNVERISGEDRTRTSFEVAKKMDSLGIDMNRAYVAGGYKGEADALSIASNAGKEQNPIILVDNYLADDVRIWLQDENIFDRFIIGGTYAVSEKVANDLKKDNTDTANDAIKVTRVGGSNIQETNAAVINTFHKEATGLLIAQDNILADALAAGPLAAKMNAPVVIGSKNITDSQKEAIRNNVGVQKSDMAGKVFNVGHGVARSVVRLIEDILSPKA